MSCRLSCDRPADRPLPDCRLPRTPVIALTNESPQDWGVVPLRPDEGARRAGGPRSLATHGHDTLSHPLLMRPEVKGRPLRMSAACRSVSPLLADLKRSSILRHLHRRGLTTLLEAAALRHQSARSHPEQMIIPPSADNRSRNNDQSHTIRHHDTLAFIPCAERSRLWCLPHRIRLSPAT